MKNLALHGLSLLNFRNYHSAEAEFCPRFNCITGANGQGKTNLLDAIYYLSFTKSFFNPIDSQNILHDQQMFLVTGQFRTGEEKFDVVCGQKRGERKVVMVNKKPVERLASHVGRFPVVMASPTDIELICDGSEIRRRLCDSVIAQYDPDYLEALMVGARALVQRNALLKKFSAEGKFNLDALQVWDEPLIRAGNYIYTKRSEFTKEFELILQKYYNSISGGHEAVSMSYRSHLQNGDLGALLNEALDKDKAMEHTTVGIHKDDWEFRMEGYPVRKFASQGQQRSYLLAIRLAQHEFTRVRKKVLPILMLDDLHDKLDDARTVNLIQQVKGEGFGQVFITGTDTSRLKTMLGGYKPDQLHFWKVESGTLSSGI